MKNQPSHNLPSNSEHSRLTSDVARELVRELAPQELPLFRAVSVAYFANPTQPAIGHGGKDDVLGFGVGEAVTLLSPIILAVTSAVFAYVGGELRQTNDVASLFRATNVKLAGETARQRGQARLALSQALCARFDLAEMKLLAVGMGFDFEDVAGNTLSEKSIELIRYCERRASLAHLAEHCARARPEVDWSAIVSPIGPDAGRGALNAAQLARVREVALEKARQLQLTDDRAALLADALVGSLAAGG